MSSRKRTPKILEIKPQSKEVQVLKINEPVPVEKKVIVVQHEESDSSEDERAKSSVQILSRKPSGQRTAMSYTSRRNNINPFENKRKLIETKNFQQSTEGNVLSFGVKANTTQPFDY